MTTPCYECCGYCQRYESCSGYGGCERCMYHKYGECRYPKKEDMKYDNKRERIRSVPNDLN